MTLGQLLAWYEGGGMPGMGSRYSGSNLLGEG